MARRKKETSRSLKERTTIVKGIGMNSPEMKLLQGEVEALKTQLQEMNEKAQVENSFFEKRETTIVKKMNEKFLLITFYIVAFIFAMWLLTMIPK